MSEQDTTPTGVETGAPKEALESKQPADNPTQDNVSQEVAELRKRLEQQEMRNNQLNNQLEEKRKAEEAAKAKQLEEQQEFKTLYEQEREAREKLLREHEERELQNAIASKKSEVLAEFPQDVQDLANEFGYSLTDTDEETVKAFKSKLEKVQERWSKGQEVTPNNPPAKSDKPVIPEGNDLKLALKDPKSFDAIIDAKFPGIAAMRTPRQE